MAAVDQPLLEVTNLDVEFDRAGGAMRVLRDVSFTISHGETLALVGESGSGKSTAALALMGLLPVGGHVARGGIRLGNRDLFALTKQEWRKVRGPELAMIFQDPLASLNPSLTVGYQIAETYRAHGDGARADVGRRVVEALESVGIPDAARRRRDYPYQFSGGMRQRIMIAIALALRPQLLIADEPTTALDVTVQAQILRLLRELRELHAMGMLLISHDLTVVANVAERIAVMYAGSIVETGPAAEVYARPAHPYTVGLIRSLPTAGQRDTELQPIPGYPPAFQALPSGCPFHPRCARAQVRCSEERPSPVAVGNGRTSACHFAHEVFGDGA